MSDARYVDRATGEAMLDAIAGIAGANGGLAASTEAVRQLLQAMFETCEIYEVWPPRDNLRAILLEMLGTVVDIVIDQAIADAR